VSFRSAAIAVSWFVSTRHRAFSKVPMNRRYGRQRVRNSSTCLKQRQKKELQPGVPNKPHLCVYHRNLAGEVHCSALSRRKKYVILSLGPISLCAPWLLRATTELWNVGLPQSSLAAHLHGQHDQVPPQCLCPSAGAVLPRTLVRPSWPSAVLPPRPTTPSWPLFALFLARSRQSLPHIPPRSLTDASETA
jgi:hypothetical protein